MGASLTGEATSAVRQCRCRHAGLLASAQFGLIALSLCALLVTGQAAPQRVPGQILVKPKPGLSDAAWKGLLAAQGANEHSAIHQIDVHIVQVPPGNVDALLGALKHNPNIEFAEPDLLLPPETTPNDTYYSLEWHLPKISAPAAWDVTTGSSNIIVAVLDSGVDATHPDLAPVLVPGWNIFDNNSDTSDVTGHGTGVAGNVGAVGNNAAGIAAVTWGCRIMPLRVADTNGYATSSMLASALAYAADHGARVANISFQATGSASLSSAGQYFQSHGGVVTVSAGNDGLFNASPDDPYLITVSATDSTDAVASFSSTGNIVDLSAPGVNIVTTVRGGSYGYATGTSASAPLVAGVAALVLSVNPALTGAQVQDILKQSADDLGPAGWDPGFGWGRLNAARAVQMAGAGPVADTTPPLVSVSSPGPGTTVSNLVSIDISATDNVGVSAIVCMMNGVAVATNSAAPAMFSWDTTKYANGNYLLQGCAYDAAGNSSTSASITVAVNNPPPPPPPDTSAPTVQITSPTSSATVSGLTTVNVAASDNVGVSRVEWYLNGVAKGTNMSAPAVFSWDTTRYPNASYTLEARAYDVAGNVGSSGPVSVSVQNLVADVIAPAVQITSPTSSVSVSGVTSVNVAASDNVGVSRVEWYLNGALAGSSPAATSFSWDTTTCPNGSCTLAAKAYDSAGNVGTSAPVTVSVNNAPPPPPPTPDTLAPTVQVTSPTNGTKVAKSAMVASSASDNVGVTRLDMLVDGKLYKSSSTGSLSFSWNTSKLGRGSHTLQGVAYDAAGNCTRSAVVTVYK